MFKLSLVRTKKLRAETFLKVIDYQAESETVERWGRMRVNSSVTFHLVLQVKSELDWVMNTRHYYLREMQAKEDI